MKVLITRTGVKGTGTWVEFASDTIAGSFAWLRTKEAPKVDALVTQPVVGREYEASLRYQAASEARTAPATATLPERHFEARPARNVLYVRAADLGPAPAAAPAT